MKCNFCGEELETGSKFCFKCGKPVDCSIKRTCPRCGTVIEGDAKFCLKCGYNSGSKKKLPIPLIAGIIVILLLVVGGTAFGLHQKAVREAYEAEQEAIREAERQRQALITSFKLKAIELNKAINGAESNFNILSTMFNTSTDLNAGLLGPSFFTSYVEGLCSSEITEEKSRKREIDGLFNELNEIGCDEEEIQELKKVIEDYYYAYIERYELLVEMDFTTTNFSSKDSTSKTDFSSKGKNVKSVIAEIKINDDLEDAEQSNSDEDADTAI